MNADREVVVCRDADDAARTAARELVRTAEAGGHIALAGGSTPRRAYEHAAQMQAFWPRASLWWGDERCVDPGNPRSNYRLVREALLDRLAQPPQAVHRIRGELGPEPAAALYDEELRAVRLDCVLLGVGPDGHTASLFPRSPALDEVERAAVAADAGLEPFVPRVTLTLSKLSEASLVHFLVAGAAKAEAVERAFARPPNAETPASVVRSRDGRTVVVLDAAAAGRLP